MANTGIDTVTPVSTSRNSADKVIKVGERPWAVVAAPSGRTAYAVSYVAEPARDAGGGRPPRR